MGANLRLINKIYSGATLKVNSPVIEDKIQLAHSYFIKNNVRITSDAINYIAKETESNFYHVIGVINTVEFYHCHNKTLITEGIVRTLVKG
ncbi:hypothetical protein FC650_21115 [Vibrio natriegens]|nr:hypothetical protein [Vibrio natriegens]